MLKSLILFLGFAWGSLLAPASPLSASPSGLAAGHVHVKANPLIVENRFLRLTFDAESGALLNARNLVTGMDLLLPGSGVTCIPQITFHPSGKAMVKSFSYVVEREDASGQTLNLTWNYARDLQVAIRLELPTNSQMAYFWPELRNEGKRSIRSLAYPSFDALATLGESAADDVLVHPFARGIKMLDPARNMKGKRDAISRASYPQAYNGMTHQLIDYYAEGLGGFFFACFDPHGTEKEVPMPVVDDRLTLSWSYESWDHRPGIDFDYGFPFVLGCNTTGDWYEAADFYREWAETTPLCTSGGRLEDRAPDRRATWLIEDIGLATFGTSAAVDQSAWYRAYHEMLGGPVFHITGHDGLHRSLALEDPLELEVSLHPANRLAFEETGDPFAVFAVDLETRFLKPHVALEVGRGGLVIAPRATPEACPWTDLFKYYHSGRALRAVLLSGADSYYCDASAPNRNLVCLSRDHGHPPGAGRWMNAGFRDLYGQTRKALNDACGQYVATGVELMHEGLLDRFDYYQARNGGGFMGGLEGGFYRGKQLQDKAETVPVFSYIFHEYAPVALDGCGKATDKIGDIFYWMASRVALAGGIFELNNEFSPTERFPGMSAVSILHYKVQDPVDWVEVGQRGNDPFDPSKGEFLREIAAARTGYGMKFLAYGRMLPPLEIEAQPLSLDYVWGGNVGWGDGKPNSTQFSDVRGSKKVRRIQTSAWKSGDRLGMFFVNLGQETLELETPLNLERYARYGLVNLKHAIRTTRAGSESTDWKPGQPLRMSLPARTVVMVEWTP